MDSKPEIIQSKKNLSNSTLLIVGIVLLAAGNLVGGIIGDSVLLASDLFSWIAIIMIIIQTFKKSVSAKTKLAGWGLVILWIIIKAVFA